MHEDLCLIEGYFLKNDKSVVTHQITCIMKVVECAIKAVGQGIMNQTGL